MRIKKLPKILFILLVIISIIGILYNIIIFKTSKKKPPQKVIIIIPEGATTRKIGEMLEKKGVITSSKRFILLAKITGEEKSIKAGRYKFHKGLSVNKVLKKLKRGEISALSVTIPEGLTIDETSVILEKQLKIDRKKFLELASEKTFASKMGIIGKNLEGFLYPDTYEFNYGVTEKEVIKRLVNRFWKVFNDSLKKRADEIGFSVYKVVTLASMIEKEAMLDSEKPIISQVYHKRLKLARPLECDATVQYALPKHKTRLLYKDLKVKSPYNTYIHKGLPPGPIASPGKESIIAALYPRDTDYLYYVAKGDGSHIFSRTAKEHQKAIRMLKHL